MVRNAAIFFKVLRVLCLSSSSESQLHFYISVKPTFILFNVQSVQEARSLVAKAYRATELLLTENRDKLEKVLYC